MVNNVHVLKEYILCFDFFFSFLKLVFQEKKIIKGLFVFGGEMMLGFFSTHEWPL